MHFSTSFSLDWYPAISANATTNQYLYLHAQIMYICLHASLYIVDWVIFYDSGWTGKIERTKLVAPKNTNGFILAKWVQGYWKNPKIKAEMA
jgi:hypothetical protein